MSDNATEMTTNVSDDGGDPHSNLTDSLKYWLDGPCCLSVAVVGVVSNAVALVVLRRELVQRTFHLLMMFLAAWDLAYLVLSVACFSLPTLSSSYRDYVFIHLVPYAIPVAQMCMFASCYSTVAITIERYVALCFPFYRLKHYLRARFFIIPILILAPLYNIPRFFEYDVRSRVTKFCANFSGGGGVPYEVTEEQYDNLTSAQVASCAGDWEDRKTAALVLTDFRKSDTYIQVYVNFFNFLVNLVAPVCVLSILNSLIYRELRRNQSAGAAGLRRNMVGRQGSIPDARAVRITRSATVIVCVFLVCHVPRFIPNVVELFITLPEAFGVLVSFNNLLQAINCSVNFLIYYGHRFRPLGRGHPNNQSGGAAAAGSGPGNQQSERIELTYRRLVVRTPFSRQTKITVVAETTSRLAAQNPERKTSYSGPSRDSAHPIL